MLDNHHKTGYIGHPNTVGDMHAKHLEARKAMHAASCNDATEPVRASEIPAQIGLCFGNTDILSMRLAGLEARLRPALRGVAPDSDPYSITLDTQIGSQLAELNARILVISDRVEMITNFLEL